MLLQILTALLPAYLDNLFHISVSPVGRQALTYDEQSWREKPEDDTAEQEDTSEKTFESNKQSKTKRVKNYLKNKCKIALGTKSTTADQKPSEESASWYLEKITNQSEVSELTEVFEDASDNLDDLESPGPYQVANVIITKAPVEDTQNNKNHQNSDTSITDRPPQYPEENQTAHTSSLLRKIQEEIDSNKDDNAEHRSSEIVQENTKLEASSNGCQQIYEANYHNRIEVKFCLDPTDETISP
ncbi:hypothetical protein WA026_021462 [Henosepilachna vigintioctopunctata]|uniref:Uncharacterized protein n=1 Tax=Henosepilachna vigintioctopunctata TaxID=420089 RepID=A0AAW1UFI5_9CUCU